MGSVGTDFREWSLGPYLFLGLGFLEDFSPHRVLHSASAEPVGKKELLESG